MFASHHRRPISIVEVSRIDSFGSLGMIRTILMVIAMGLVVRAVNPSVGTALSRIARLGVTLVGRSESNSG